MKNLFDPALVKDTTERILQLHPGSARQWGSMDLAPTLAHCTASLDMAIGVLRAQRAPFPANLVGRLIRPLVLRDNKPMRRNSPSSPELFQAKPASCDLATERSRLIAAIDSFAVNGPAGCSPHPHPFFGPLQPGQWAILTYKHVDHHLRQFGV